MSVAPISFSIASSRLRRSSSIGRCVQMFYSWDGNLGFDPAGGGLVIDTDGTCWQHGVQVNCEVEFPVWDGSGLWGQGGGGGSGPPYGVFCPPGFRIDPTGVCVSISGSGVGPSPSDFGTPPQPPAETPFPDVGPIKVSPPVPVPVPITPVSAPPISTSPVWRPRKHKPRPMPRPEPITGELCPARGWVSRAIPGVNEYRTVACTPGKPVVIDQGLATVVRQGALQRAGLGDLEGFTIGNITLPTWALAVGAGLVLFTLMGKKRGR